MATTSNKAAAEAAQGGDKSVDLQNQVDSLTSENTALKAENSQLKGQVSTLTNDRDTLAKANAVLEGKNDELNVQLVEAEDLIEQQTAQLKSAEVGQKLGPVIVTHDKEQYQVLVPRFSHAGNLVEAASLRQNPDLVRQMVESGSGLLQKVEATA